MAIMIIVSIIVGIPLVTTSILYKYKKKYLFLSPLSILLINFYIIWKSIASYFPSEPIRERIRLYFVNDASMFFGLQVIMTLFSLFLYVSILIYDKLKKRKLKP